MSTTTTTTTLRTGTDTTAGIPGYVPTFEAEDTVITAGEIEPGDWLVETLPFRGVPGHRFEHLVESVSDGPAFRSSEWDGPSIVSRVRLTLFGSTGPLLTLGTPVVIRRRLS